MGSHGDGVSIAAAIHTSVFGESVTYNPASGDPLVVDAILYPIRKERRESSMGAVEVDVLPVAIETSSLSNAEILETLTIDSQDWLIEKLNKTANRWMLELVRVDVAEITRQNYRRGRR